MGEGTEHQRDRKTVQLRGSKLVVPLGFPDPSRAQGCASQVCTAMAPTANADLFHLWAQSKVSEEVQKGGRGLQCEEFQCDVFE